MKKTLAILAVALLVCGTAALAVDDVRNTKHNLSSTAGGTGAFTDATMDEICVFCHTPHHGNPKAPLWNHAYSTTQVYTDYTSTTKNMSTSWTNAPGISRMCLSCHDGTLGLGAVQHTPAGKSFSLASSNLTGGTLLGTDLSAEHPVALLYNQALDSAFRLPATVNASNTALLYTADAGSTYYVECGSCHKPHEATNVPFLRAANTGSAICLACHLK